MSGSHGEIFELAGPQWANLWCMAVYGLVIAPGGFLLLCRGVYLRLLGRRMRGRDYTDRQLARIALRFRIDGLERKGGLDRIRRRMPQMGIVEIALGLLGVSAGALAFLWILYAEPQRLAIDDDKVTLVYAWPLSERSVRVAEIQSIEYRVIYQRKGGQRAELHLAMRDGSAEEIATPGYRGRYDRLREAAVLIATNANLPLRETSRGTPKRIKSDTTR